ncbi:MAG: hypothetical protein AABW86_02695 [Candidatus Micrarchaeota archaeon]
MNKIFMSIILVGVLLFAGCVNVADTSETKKDSSKQKTLTYVEKTTEDTKTTKTEPAKNSMVLEDGTILYEGSSTVDQNVYGFYRMNKNGIPEVRICNNYNSTKHITLDVTSEIDKNTNLVYSYFVDIAGANCSKMTNLQDKTYEITDVKILEVGEPIK